MAAAAYRPDTGESLSMSDHPSGGQPGQLTDSLNFSQFLDGSINVDRLLQQALLWLHD